MIDTRKIRVGTDDVGDFTITAPEHEFEYGLAEWLKVTEDRYREDARTMKEAGHPRLAEQFERQAAEVRRVLDLIAEALEGVD